MPRLSMPIPNSKIAGARIAILENECATLHAVQAELKTSTSWKVTAPLRRLSGALKALLAPGTEYPKFRKQTHGLRYWFAKQFHGAECRLSGASQGWWERRSNADPLVFPLTTTYELTSYCRRIVVSNAMLSKHHALTLSIGLARCCILPSCYLPTVMPYWRFWNAWSDDADSDFLPVTVQLFVAFLALAMLHDRFGSQDLPHWRHMLYYLAGFT